MSLPQEVLALVFSHLEANDLLQCQLTSKQWHSISLRPLYSNLLGNTEEKVSTYVRTISYSPQLGKYLNTINFATLFYRKTFLYDFDKFGLLDAIIQYCPYITKIDGHVDDFRFWPRLRYAATQGQLSRLESLPRAYIPTLKSYINTTLVFKNSLTCLCLSVGELYNHPHLADLSVYGTLFNQIDQFKNLKTLKIVTNKYLSHFDELIDKCHSLKTLSIKTHAIKLVQQPNEPGQTILPRPDIQSLEYCWGQITVNNQLEYMMCKFPNLQRLRVECRGYGYACFGPTLVKFIQYVISIPDFELNLVVDNEDLPNIFTEFTKIKNGCKNITLDCFSSFNNFYRIDLSVKEGLSVKLPISIYGNEIPHINLFYEAGKSVGSLRIGYVVTSNMRRNRETSTSTITWLFEILQLCPLLEEIAIGNPSRSSPIHHTSQYPSVKKLTVDNFEDMGSIDFLSCLSLSFPNLRQLSLDLNNKNIYPIIIDMPHTSLDLLVWSDASYGTGPGVYIKLNTDKGLKYYLGIRSILLPISQSRYLLSRKSDQFDISCKHLKELRIRRRKLPGLDSDFVI